MTAEPSSGGEHMTETPDTTDTPDTLTADAPPGDTYGREQAAKVLGVSARRVSQLVESGRLLVVQERPLRVSAESVNTLRAERRSNTSPARSTATPPESVAEQVERLVSLIAGEQRKAIEVGEHLLAEVTTQRDELKAEADRLRDELTAERDRARVEAETLRAELAAKSRPWWKR